MKNLRQRMIEDMKIRGLAPGSQATYLEAIKALARHYKRRPDEITQEQVKDYLLYLIEPKGYAKSMYKVSLRKTSSNGNTRFRTDEICETWI